MTDVPPQPPTDPEQPGTPPPPPPSYQAPPPPSYQPPPPGYPQSPTGPASGPGGAVLADWPKRALALLIEWGVSLAIYFIGFILAAIMGAIADGLQALMLLITYAAALGWWIYNGYLNGETGQSFGKQYLKIKVVSEVDGSLIGGGMGVVRAFAHILDSLACYVGWFWPLWDTKRQTFADKVMKTSVIVVD